MADVLKELGRQLGLTGRYLAQGAGGLGAMLAEPLAYGMNKGLEAAGSDYRFPGQFEALSNALTEAGLPEPEGTLEEYVGLAGEMGVPDPSDLLKLATFMGLKGASRLAHHYPDLKVETAVGPRTGKEILSDRGKAAAALEGGEHPLRVWSQFGFRKNPGGELQWELLDDKMRVNDLPEWDNSVGNWERAYQETPYTVADRVDHGNHLLDIYPELAEMSYATVPGAPFQAATVHPHWDVPNGAILFNPKADSILASMAHELQHGVQKQEGWVTGARPQALENPFKRPPTPGYVAHLMEGKNPATYGLTTGIADTKRVTPGTAYKTKLGEADARLTGDRVDLGQHSRNWAYPDEMYDVPVESIWTPDDVNTFNDLLHALKEAYKNK